MHFSKIIRFFAETIIKMADKKGNKFKYKDINGFNIELGLFGSNCKSIDIEIGGYMNCGSEDYHKQMKRFKELFRHKVNSTIRNHFQWHTGHVCVVEWSEETPALKLRNKFHYVSINICIYSNEIIEFTNAKRKKIGVEDEVFTFCEEIVKFVCNVDGLCFSPRKK